jgi:protein phosphatase
LNPKGVNDTMRICHRTHQGKVRSSNQDSLLVDERIYGVADGMGGHNGGETASRVAVQVLKNALRGKKPEPRALEVGMEAANRRIFDMSRHDSALSGMGTTTTLLWENGKEALICHVGDSRAYGVNRDGIRRLTTDHSLVQMMITRGELTPQQARTYPGKNYITRAVGTEPVLECDVFHVDVERGDCLLLCTDGLTNTMDDQEILFEVVHGVNKQHCCQRLLDIAKNRGAPDNVTSVMVLV